MFYQRVFTRLITVGSISFLRVDECSSDCIGRDVLFSGKVLKYSNNKRIAFIFIKHI